jgi:SAM-dependent methyltransferase
VETAVSAAAGAPREQRLVFGEDARLYDRARPGYPAALVGDVLEFAGADPPLAAIEVGAGTGKATVAFAAAGVAVLAIEPDEAMGAVASENCERFASVEVVRASFEDWRVEPGTFDLLFSAQAWHWIRPEVRCDLAAAHLRPGGTVALFWHRADWADDDPLRLALDECYRRHAPELYAKGPGFPGLTPATSQVVALEELAASPHFRDVTVHHHPWQATFSAAAFVDLLATQSDHRMLPPTVRGRLFEEVRGVVTAHGAPMAVPYDILLLLGRRAG